MHGEERRGERGWPIVTLKYIIIRTIIYDKKTFKSKF